MRFVLIGAAALTSGCMLVGGHGPPGRCDPGAATDCIEVAMHASGAPDGCDLAACVSCVDACPRGCAVMESYPPRYACDGEGTWDVYDTCPDWVPPGTTDTPRAEDVVDLGCGTAVGETLTAVAAGPGRISVVHTDYLVGCCPAAVEVDVLAAGSVLVVAYTLVDDDCECACMLDVSYDLVDVPYGTWTIVAGPSGATAVVTLPG